MTERYYQIEARWFEDGSERTEPVENSRTVGDISPETLTQGPALASQRQFIREMFGEEAATKATFIATEITREEFYPD